MGNSANMAIQTDNQHEVQTFVTNLNCFYDGGEYGSNPSVFNGARITPAGSPFPSAAGQNIQAKNSGECFGADSTMNLKINDYNTNQEIGEVDFVENDGWTYNIVGPNPNMIDVDINGEQTFIMVTVQPWPSDSERG